MMGAWVGKEKKGVVREKNGENVVVCAYKG